MKITIDEKLKSLTPNYTMSVITCDVEVLNSHVIDEVVTNIEDEVNDTYEISDVINIPLIKAARDAYKAYGKDPSRYRLAVESLYRRLSKGNKLYRINSIVDAGNVLSIHTKKSVACLDMDYIEGDIVVRLGLDSDDYEGIGRGKLNIENIPLYEDTVGPFGSATSDTPRTMIRPETKKLLLFIISFTGVTDLEEDTNYAIELLTNFANGSNFKNWIVE